jgi:hypothetical protein
VADAPLRPHLQGARSKCVRQRRQTIADYTNHLLANSSGDWVTLRFGEIALKLGVDKRDVVAAIGEDGGNGLGVRITPEARDALERYREWPLARQ